jgi:hypothetical protein
MNFLNENDGARTWSGRLGTLAAESPMTNLPQFDRIPSTTRLAAILSHFHRRQQSREHAADTLRANEFLTGM